MYGWSVPMFQAFLWVSAGFIFPLPWSAWWLWLVVTWGMFGWGLHVKVRSWCLGLALWLSGSFLHESIPSPPPGLSPFTAECLLQLEERQKDGPRGSRWLARVQSGNLRPGKRLMLYLPNQLMPKPRSGDVWAVQGKASFPHPANGKGFQADRWLQDLGCSFTLRVREPCEAIWQKHDAAAARSHWRNWWKLDMEVPWLDSTDRGFLQALMLGDKSELPQDVQTQFSKAGLSHILAVSGMHVGLIFVVVAWMVKWMPPFWWVSRLLKFFIPIVFVWGFVWLSGMGASALRAGLMCSLVQLGVLFNRSVNGLNLLGWAGIILVCYDPALWWTPGFQLSFLAVWGLLVWTKPFSVMLPAGRWQKWASGIPVTLAAQWATTPVSIFYFGQFPLYFLITNLCAVPLVTWILYLAMGAIAFAKLGLTIPLAFEALHYCIQGLVWISQWPNFLPVGVISGLTFSPLEATLTTLCLFYLSWNKHLWVWILAAWSFWFSPSLVQPSRLILPFSYANVGKGRVEVKAGGQTWTFSHGPNPTDYALPALLHTTKGTWLLTQKWHRDIRELHLPVIWLGKTDYFPEKHHGWCYLKEGRWWWLPPTKNPFGL